MTETLKPVLDAFGIVTSDLAASLAFYAALGITDITRYGDTHAEADLPGGARLMWDVAEGEAPGTGGVALAFRCASPQAVEEAFAGLAAQGHGHTEPFDAPWGQRYASLRDPDGNPVDLYCLLP